mmetsp:Transcript_16821/g.24917  ORF Transcript_16821/g.24917 Transcript_16821/m.24917 type:complete len:94 (-) Transcript_16821:173-454(-)
MIGCRRHRRSKIEDRRSDGWRTTSARVSRSSGTWDFGQVMPHTTDYVGQRSGEWSAHRHRESDFHEQLMSPVVEQCKETVLLEQQAPLDQRIQ